MLRLPKKTAGWTHLLKKQGSNYLVWLAANKIVSDKFNVLATALWSLLQQRIQTEQEAGEVWNAVPAVLARCNEQATYEMPGAPLAYAWVHLLDRYARTWRALELLVAGGCLPLAKFGVRALDVGTGPGPSAFAVHDFYAALTQFARETGIEELNQPPDITCVEFDEGTNALRHDLAEVIFVQSGGASPSVLRMCGSLRDFKMLLPMEERMQMRITCGGRQTSISMRRLKNGILTPFTRLIRRTLLPNLCIGIALLYSATSLQA